MLNLIRDNNENGATVKVAEGNYLGYMNAGYIEIYNWITLEGGCSPAFSQRNPLKFITRIEPDQSHKGTNGSKGLITLSKLDDVLSTRILGTVTIDGFMLNMGYGYEFMTAVNADVHHNIFLCNNYSALARTHVLSGPDAPIEAKRVTNLYDNAFFMNAADLQLCKWKRTGTAFV